MIPSLLSVVICISAVPPAGTLLQYEGQITADREEGIRKEVKYTALVVAADEKNATVYWVVSEKGQGAWPWIEQFGELQIDAEGKVTGGRPASVLFEHADGISPVALSLPIFGGPKALEAGAAWRADRLQFEVSAPEDKETAKQHWQIDVATAIGRKRTLLVDKSRQVVTELDETVFMGPGKKHRLQLALIDDKQLEGADLAQAKDAFAALSELRDSLEYQTQGGRVQWNDDQLAKMKQALPEIIKTAAGTPMESLALLAGGNVKLQNAVAAATEALQKRFVGQPAPKLELKSASLSGPALSTTKAEGQPMVLHVWDYKDNPLVEPYGQIGYLDFLYRRHKEDGVLVFGIAVDDRLDRPDARSDAIRSVRKLQSFMNIGYPVVLGGQQVLEQLGDPVRLGAELPLVVVIDGEGKITHYHLGLYDVDREQGLAELDAAVKKVK